MAFPFSFLFKLKSTLPQNFPPTKEQCGFPVHFRNTAASTTAPGTQPRAEAARPAGLPSTHPPGRSREPALTQRQESCSPTSLSSNSQLLHEEAGSPTEVSRDQRPSPRARDQHTGSLGQLYSGQQDSKAATAMLRSALGPLDGQMSIPLHGQNQGQQGSNNSVNSASPGRSPPPTGRGTDARSRR